MTEPQTLADELGLATMDLACKEILARYIANPDEQDRINHNALLGALTTHSGAWALDAHLRAALRDPLNLIEHRALLPYAGINALVKRVIDERATTYDEPAARSVGSGQERFDALSKAIGLDRVMRAATRKLVAHEVIWLSLRIRDDRPILDCLTPAQFWAIAPTSDPTHMVAVMTEIPQRLKPEASDPKYRIATRWQTVVCNSKMELLYADANPLGDLPGVLIALEPASVTQRLLPARANADLAAAETAGAFQILMASVHSLTVPKQAYVSGDTSALAMGQSASSQREVILGEGVTVTAVDRSVDIAQYLDHADRIADTAAANAGLAPATRKLQSAASGYELWLRQVPLVKRRRELVDVLREGEERLAQHMARVIDLVGLDEYRFSPAGFAIRFGELSMPQSEAEELATFETKRRLGLADTLEEVADREQVDEDTAAERIATHAERETARIGLLQDLSRVHASASTGIGDQTNGNRGPTIGAPDAGTNTEH